MTIKRTINENCKYCGEKQATLHSDGSVNVAHYCDKQPPGPSNPPRKYRQGEVLFEPATSECRVTLQQVGEMQIAVIHWPDGSYIHVMPFVIPDGQDPAEQLQNWMDAWIAADLTTANQRIAELEAKADELECTLSDEEASHQETLVQLTAANEKCERLERIVTSVVRNCRHIDDTTPRDEVGPMCGPTWAKVAHVCGLGSTSAIALCREKGVDPDYDCTANKLGGES